MAQLFTISQVAKALDVTLDLALTLVQAEFPAGRDLFSKDDCARLRVGLQRAKNQSGQLRFDFDHGPSNAVLEARFLEANAIELHNPDRAITLYREIISLDIWHASAHVNLGRLLHQKKRFREAQTHYTAALVIRPHDALATYNLAVVLGDMGAIDEAMVHYRKAIELNPENVDAYFNLSRLYERKGEKVQALRHLNDYRRLMTK